MKKLFKQILSLVLLVMALITITACGDKKFTVEFNVNGGTTEIADQSVFEGETVKKPSVPKKAEYEFIYWYLDNEEEEFDFDSKITDNIILNAYWLKSEDLALEDYNKFIEEGLVVNPYLLNLPKEGSINGTSITWEFDSKYISKSGIVLPLVNETETNEVTLKATFKRGTYIKEEEFIVEVKEAPEVIIDYKKEVEFKNLTTEFDVEDGNLELFFEEDGSVPYVNILDFIELVKGFVDPDIEFEVTKTDTTLEIVYDYYDENRDHTYNLVNTVDLQENTISTNDPGFYVAYVYSTETNYGRHIEYLYNHSGNYYQEGDDVVYKLSDYNLSLTSFEGEILAPLYLVNQLYAGSSYYNVYYNFDNLYGIYALPSSDDAEYKTIKTSSKNKEDLPVDLLIHTINTFAFNMDYFYGLKDILEIETFYDFIFDMKENLFTTNPRSFDTALADILVDDLDEPHTSFGYPSFYNVVSWGGPKIMSVAQFGQRMQEWYNDGLYAVDDAIEAKWGRVGIASNAWAASSLSRPDYWFLDDKHAVLTFDSFSTKDIEESNEYDKSLAEKVLEVDNIDSLLPKIEEGNKFFYYNTSSTDYRKLELLVKGLKESDFQQYLSSVNALGYTHVIEDTNEEFKEKGYYTIELDDESYFLVLNYNKRFNLFYLGITNEEAPDNYKDEWPITTDVIKVVKQDSAVYFEMVLEELFEEKPSIESITIDLTWNTGGNVGALYRVVGFVTDQAFKVSSMNRASGSASTTHIKIDGVPSYSHIKWALLTSKATFSAGNSLATIFKENKLGPVIGVQSGGGASSITPILLPNGTAFTMSSNNISGYRIGSGSEQNPYEYLDNEYGIKPDYELDMKYIYNESSILGALKSYFK